MEILALNFSYFIGFVTLFYVIALDSNMKIYSIYLSIQIRMTYVFIILYKEEMEHTR